MKCTKFPFQTNGSFKVQVKMIKKDIQPEKNPMPPKKKHNKYFAWG